MELSTNAHEIFYQIFTVHAFTKGQQFLLAYCLLPDKTPSSYQWTFTLLKAKAEKLHLEFSPNIAVTDFELAIIQAAELSFPAATITGSYYHYCQCLNRKIQQIGLQVAYQENHQLNRFVWKTAALAFVPPRFVRLAWQAVKFEAPELPRIEELSHIVKRHAWLVGNFSLQL